jgi:hypothetical protein
MLTIIESPLFERLWPDYWTELERGEFAAFLSKNPDAGDVIEGSGGCRKIRWSYGGIGKRGGVRVIYVNWIDEDCIVLLTLYAKNVNDNIPADVLRKLAKELGHAPE